MTYKRAWKTAATAQCLEMDRQHPPHMATQTCGRGGETRVVSVRLETFTLLEGTAGMDLTHQATSFPETQSGIKYNLS